MSKENKIGAEEAFVNDPIADAATKLAEATDTDILLYSGDIQRGYDDKLLDMLGGLRRRENVLLILCTRGGNPDAAYRMARGLQSNYSKFTVLLAGRCKSAGTLLVLGAHELAMTDHAELGPLDVQLGKKDEIFEMDSGLTVLNALTELESKAFELFESTFLRIKFQSEGSITFKTATHIATELAKGIVAPIMAQIDPLHVGEVSRALKIGAEYGRRLIEGSCNANEESLKTLVEGYPSHAFVIDKAEAKELFQNVRDASPDEAALVRMKNVRAVVRIPKSDGPIMAFISRQKEQEEAANDADNPEDAQQREDATGTGNPADEGIVGGQEPAGPGAVPELQLGRRNGTRSREANQKAFQ